MLQRRLAPVMPTPERSTKRIVTWKRRTNTKTTRFNRGHLLLDHLRILLAGKRDKEATKVFRTLRRLARKERALSDVMIDAHVAIAEYTWTEEKQKLEALKAYSAGSTTPIPSVLSAHLRSAVIWQRCCFLFRTRIAADASTTMRND